MKTTAKDFERADLKPLAAAVILQAIRDMKHGDTVRALDAALWFVSDDFGIWAEACGIPFADGCKLLTSGALQRKRVKK